MIIWYVLYTYIYQIAQRVSGKGCRFSNLSNLVKFSKQLNKFTMLIQMFDSCCIGLSSWQNQTIPNLTKKFVQVFTNDFTTKPLIVSQLIWIAKVAIETKISVCMVTINLLPYRNSFLAPVEGCSLRLLWWSRLESNATVH